MRNLINSKSFPINKNDETIYVVELEEVQEVLDSLYCKVDDLAYKAKGKLKEELEILREGL